MNKEEMRTPFQIYSGRSLTVRFDEGLLLFFGLRGRCVVTVGEEQYPLEKAGLLLINPLTIYRLHCPLDASVLVLRVEKEVLEREKWQGDCICYRESSREESGADRKVRELLAQLFQYYFEHPETALVTHSRYLSELLHNLKTRFPGGALKQPARESTMLRLGSILDRIADRWNEELSLNAIAEEEYLSVSYLSRFFQKNLGESFSQYLRELRLNHSAAMLSGSSASVTRIAYDCGFHAPSAFIEVFKQAYGMTPGQYREEIQALQKEQADHMTGGSEGNDLTALLGYVPETEEKSREERGVHADVDVRKRQASRMRPGRRILNIGYAADGLLAPVQQQIRRAQRDIGFEFVRFHGLLDEDMHIYWEDREGKPEFCFYSLDLLFDFILEAGLTPFVELSFMPKQLAREETRIFDRPSVISGCRDIEKWQALIMGVLTHLVERYGSEQVRNWRFTTISQSYVHLKCVDWEDYQDLYAAAFHAVKAVDEEIPFGGPGCFAELISEEQGVPAFLSFARERDCVPDFIGFQFYPHVHTYDSMFMDFTLSQQSAPAILSENPDYLSDSLNALEMLLEEDGLSDREIYIEECTSTLWQRDLSGDTCYKAAWIAKNGGESFGRAVLGYWLLTDLLEERSKIESVYHGGYGLMTYSGIPKAGYRSMELLGLLGNDLVSAGEGWILTASGEEYTLLLYNYCHYSNLYRYRYQRLEEPQHAYTVFEQGSTLHFRLVLRGLTDGKYRITRHLLDREHGSSFDLWLNMNAPRYLSGEETHYLEEESRVKCRVEDLPVEGSFYVESRLEPHAVEVIQLRRR